MIYKQKCCCTCEHDIRTLNRKTKMIECHCEIDGHCIGYCDTFDDCCEHWENDTERKEE